MVWRTENPISLPSNLTEKMVKEGYKETSIEEFGKARREKKAQIYDEDLGNFRDKNYKPSDYIEAI